MLNIDQLNSKFAIEGQLHFIAGKGGFPLIVIDNEIATALISTYAGQVLAYQPVDSSEELFFVSEKAYYQPGKAIKGGVPICWPWFGDDPEDKGRAAHGFVRNRQWEVSGTKILEDDSIQVRLNIKDNDETREIWPCSFQLILQVTVGSSLSIELLTHNTGNEPFFISQALHTYFKVGDISQVQVLGLENHDYLDKADKGLKKLQAGPVVIENEVDRIYMKVKNKLMIADASLGRNIHINSSGSQTAVVWNPWVKIAAAMGDLNNEDYRHMLCVETVNAVDDIVQIQPGSDYRLKVNYSIESHQAS
mgnify:CR=1 FL=1